MSHGVEKPWNTCDLHNYAFQFVVLSFWGIYAVDRELVYPKELDKIIPAWLNHIMVRAIVLDLVIKIQFS